MRWFKKVWIPLVYALLTLAMTYPLVLCLSTHYVGTGSDLWMFPWNDWWCQKCLVEGRSPFFTTWLFYPPGVSLVYHNFAWLNTAIGILLSPLVGSIASYNLIFLFNLALGGVAMHALAYDLTKDHRAAFVAGLIFAFWPYRMTHFNHPNMISTEWVPLCLLFFMRTIREERKVRSALLAGLFLALTGLSRSLLLMFAGGVILVYLAYSMLFEREHWRGCTWRNLGALVLTFGLAAALMAPLLSPLVMTQVRGAEQAGDLFMEREHLHNTDLITYLLPRDHPLLRTWLSDLWSRTRRGAYLGYTALALAGIGALKTRRERVFWLSVGVGLFVMALGPDLQVAGRHLDVRLPYAWVQDWGLVRAVRHPNRFNILLGLPLAALAGYGAAWLLPRLRRSSAWVLGLSALVLFEYLPCPYPTIRPDVPPFYRQLAREPGDFGVLDLPLGSSTVGKLYMYFATVHGKALVEGHVSRLPDSAYAFIDSVPLLRGLHVDGEIDPALCDVSRQLSTLSQADIRYVILHPDWVAPDRLARWQEWLAVPPAYEDPHTIVYRTRLQHGRDFEFLGTVGDGIGVIDGAAIVHPDRTLEVTVVWGTEDAPSRDWTARVALVAPTGTEVPVGDLVPCAGWPTVQWGVSTVARGHGTWKVGALADPGTYAVTLSLVDPLTDVAAGRLVTIGRVEIRKEQP